MKKLTDTLNQFQVLIATILSILATVGVDKAGLLKTLQNPFEWTAWQALFFGVVALIIGIAVVRQRYANVSRLKDPNALRLDPAEPSHLLGRAEDIDRVAKALDLRGPSSSSNALDPEPTAQTDPKPPFAGNAPSYRALPLKRPWREVRTLESRAGHDIGS